LFRKSASIRSLKAWKAVHQSGSESLTDSLATNGAGFNDVASVVSRGGSASDMDYWTNIGSGLLIERFPLPGAYGPATAACGPKDRG
jgi:hypothetical protein